MHSHGQNVTMRKKKIKVLIVSDLDRPLKPGMVEQREEEAGSPGHPAVKRLWAFSCELSRGRSVSSMAWNKRNPVTQTSLPLSANKTVSAPVKTC